MKMLYTAFMLVWATEMPTYHFDLKTNWPQTGDLHLQKNTSKNLQHFSLTRRSRHHPPVLHSTNVPTATTQQVTQMTSQPWKLSSPCVWCHLSLQHSSQHMCCPSSSALMLHAIPSFSGLNLWGRTDTFFTVRVVKHWKWLSKEAVVSPPSLEIHKISLDKTSDNLMYLWSWPFFGLDDL